MEQQIFYAGMIVIGVLCLILAGAIWALYVATDPMFDNTVKRNNEFDDLMNEELAANQRLLAVRKPASNVNHPVYIIHADEVDIV